jgi:hypothetical protein
MELWERLIRTMDGEEVDVAHKSQWVPGSIWGHIMWDLRGKIGAGVSLPLIIR